MNTPEAGLSRAGETKKEKVGLDAKVEKSRRVAIDPEEIAARLARMKELESEVIPKQTEQIMALKRELKTVNEEYAALQEKMNIGDASFADLQRFEEIQTDLASRQKAVETAELGRSESRRELALLDESHADVYKAERAAAESNKKAFKKAMESMDEDAATTIRRMITQKKSS
ncbi:hypothetical protein IT407_01805 [Candidatus Uhrbacteria bacterium]|nr:hypothetical protein [Candidatus Uhrbacteria bacterium]